MKIFITKAILFCLLVSVLYVFPVAIYVVSKDYLPLSSMLDIQKKNKGALIGFSYFGESYVDYKKLLFKNTKPDLFVFGSSRAFHTRQEFFIDNATFANIAVPRPSIGNFVNIKDFLSEVPDDGKERVLILLLDRRFFTERYESSSDSKNKTFIEKFSHLIGKPLRLLYLDYFNGKYSFIELIHESTTSHNIGLWALVRDSGFREDGSVKEGYAVKIKDRKERLAVEVNDRVSSIDMYSPTLLEKEKSNIPLNLKSLEEILSICKEKNITVIGFIPPDPLPVFKKMQTATSSYALLQRELTRSIGSIFKQYNYSFYDMANISLYGGRDDEFLDMIHAGDLLYAKLYIYMASKDKTLIRYINPNLKSIVKKTKGDFFEW